MGGYIRWVQRKKRGRKEGRKERRHQGEVDGENAMRAKQKEDLFSLRAACVLWTRHPTSQEKGTECCTEERDSTAASPIDLNVDCPSLFKSAKVSRSHIFQLMQLVTSGATFFIQSLRFCACRECMSIGKREKKNALVG
jgi:hypothetical protein